jgi:uncharacterized protein (TIGR02679 family)
MSLPDWVASPALAPLWERVRARLESTGLEPRGRVTVSVSSRDERHAVGALLGRPVTRSRVVVDLGALDSRLAARSGVGGLAAVVEAVTGRPLRDRPSERLDLARRRDEPLELARTLVDGPWVETWLAGLRQTGLLTNRPDAAKVVSDAAAVLGLVVGAEVVPRSRVDLGARLLGDAHALDEDRLQHLVVLRGLAAASGVAVPASAGERRALWQDFGIGPDLVSSTCLTLGLRLAGSDALSVRLGVAADDGDPVHLTAWDLRRWGLAELSAQTVLVCENPRVLEAVAETYGGQVPVVCTSGEPNTVVTTLLERLVGAGCELRYHGDFDWPGIAIANRLVARFGVTPWLMSASDYEAGVRPESPASGGTPAEPSWDAELGAAMRLHAVAVHEEAVLDALLETVPGLLSGLASVPGRSRGWWSSPGRCR